MDKPPTEAIMQALQQLYALAAINERGELTKVRAHMHTRAAQDRLTHGSTYITTVIHHRPLWLTTTIHTTHDHHQQQQMGRRMAEFPLEPMHSKALLASEKYKCSDDVITILSMLTVGNSIFYRPKDRAVQYVAWRSVFACAYMFI